MIFSGRTFATATGLAARAGSVLLTLVMVNYASAYLDQTSMGVLMLVLGLTVILPVLDLGAGNALTNDAAHAIASGNGKSAAVITGGLEFVFAVSAVMAIVGLLVSVFLEGVASGQDAVTSVTASSYSSVRVFLFLCPFVVLSNALLRVYIAMERSYVHNLISAFLNFIFVIILLLLKRNSVLSSVSVLCLLYFAPQVLAVPPCLWLLFRAGCLKPFGAPLRVFASGRRLIGAGLIFLMLQIGVVIGWGGDPYIIASMLGAGSVASYALAIRIFQTAVLPISMYNQPLWGVYALAHARGDRSLIKSTLVRSMLITSCAAITVTVLVFLVLDSVLAVWASGKIQVPVGLAALMACWVTLDCIGNCAATYLNGCSVLRPQIYSVATFCLLSVTLKFLFGSYMGLEGIVLATVAAYIICVPMLYIFMFRREVEAPIKGVS